MIEEAIKAALIAEYDAIPPREELEKMYTFSERHEKRMEELFANMHKFDKKRRRRHLVRKVAIIMIAVLALAYVSVKFVPVVYAYVKEWLMELADDESMEFRGKSSDDSGAAGEELQFELGYVPDGYELVSEEHTKTGSGVVVYKHYEGQVIKLKYNKATAIDMFAVNIEEADVKQVDEEGVLYSFFECQDRRSELVWEYKGYVCNIEGMFNKKEMIDIAKSMQIKKK